MDVKTTKANRWCEHIRKFAKDNSLSYREAMRSEACKTAYKSPEPAVSAKKKPVPEPVREPDPMPMPALVRSEVETIPLIPVVIKKERKRREAKMVPT
jgi:hypothetical protein